MSKVLLFFLISFSGILAQDNIRIMSFNFPTAKQNKWEKIGTTLKVAENTKGERLKTAKKLIESSKPDFICFQETHKDDITKFLKSNFIKSNYNSYSPEVNDKDSETNAIFYSKKYKLLEKGIIYLNEKGKKGLNSWDDKHQRACTWIFVQNIKKPSEKFYIFNLHLGLTQQSRENSLKIIYEKADNLRKQEIVSFIVGDFNAKPEGPTFQSLKSYNFKNIRDLTPADKIYGPAFTYTGYDEKSMKTMDHILVSMPERINPLEFITIKTTTGARPSDHFPLMATLQLI